MDNQTLENTKTAEVAEATGKEEAAAVLGKFKDVQALMDAYSRLEAEFTRRSQRLKELENAKKEQTAPAEAANAEAPSQQADDRRESLIERALGDEGVRDAVISEYLAQVAANKGVPFVTGGVNVAAKKNAPATVREAGRLAKSYFNKREENN